MQTARAREAAGGGGGQAGFTLVEALVAMVILVFGLIAVTNLMVVASTSNAIANRSTTAASVAMEEMERLKAIDFPSLVPGGNLGTPTPPYTRYVPLPGGGNIRTNWLIVPAGAVGASPVMFITVRSEEQSSIGRQRTRAEYTTFRTPW